MEKSKFQLLFSGILGATGVALGALGAHGLRPRLDEAEMLEAWETAVLYHLVHAVALLAIGLANRTTTPLGRSGFWAAAFWIGGVLLFSGSLYLLALGGPGRILGPVTPVGGILLIAGWGAVAFGGFQCNSRRN